jgi:ligand-binding sensor domain-containing protein
MKKQIILFLLCVSQLIARSQDIAKQNYGHLSLEDGLTQGYITAIVQDKTGYMWFGTNDGLNRYDGYNFRKFYNKLNDTTSLSSNQITSLSVDRNGILWIGTSNGLNYFDPVTDRFYHCKINSKVYKSQSINCVNVDKNGLVWFTYIDDPFLYKYNSESKKTETFKIPQNKDYAASKILNSKTWSEDITTWTFFESSDGLIWIGASSGELISFNKTNSIFKKYSPVNMNAIITSIIEVDKDRLVLGFSDGSFCFFDSGIGIRGQLYEINPAKAKNSSTAVYRMIADKNKNFYIGTQGEGLFFFDRNKKTLDQILFVDHSDRNIISKGAYSLYISKSGVLWTGTNGYGVYCLFPMSSAFKTINQGFRYTKENYHSNDLEIYASFGSREVYKSLRFQSVRGIYATDKFILVGGYVGLDKIDRIKGDIENISSEIVPYVFCPDLENPDNYLWIGTESTNFPLLRFDIQNKKLSGEPIDCKYIFSILPEKENILWLGTSSGLIKFNVKSKARTFFKNIPEDPKSLQPGAIRVIIRDNDGILWVGSETGGLSMLNENNGEFIRYQHNPSNIKSLSCNTVLFATVDKFNNIIIGTGGGGINVFDKHRETFTHITTQNGLPNNVVYAIMEDNNGIYWASTNNGICSINPKNLNIKCYYSSDGLQSNEFNTGSYFKDKNGFLYFGGVNGITYFDPDKIIENDFKPDVVLTYGHL